MAKINILHLFSLSFLGFLDHFLILASEAESESCHHTSFHFHFSFFSYISRGEARPGGAEALAVFLEGRREAYPLVHATSPPGSAPLVS